ncbi:MAG: hypothetical protein ACI80V_003021 [Rhodothermales bacterium]|jgi:hypothetical protein
MRSVNQTPRKPAASPHTGMAATVRKNEAGLKYGPQISQSAKASKGANNPTTSMGFGVGRVMSADFGWAKNTDFRCVTSHICAFGMPATGRWPI